MSGCGGCAARRRAQQARRVEQPSASKAEQQFALVKRGGDTVTYGSKLEAEAENARAGYTGIVKPVGS